MTNKYDYMEPVLQIIDSKYISLNEEEERSNGQVLKHILDYIIERMKFDYLFKKMYSEKFYGGSHWDGIKTGYPDERDVDIKLTLPASVEYDFVLVESNEPGFVNIKCTEMGFRWNRRTRQEVAFYGEKGLNKIIDRENYLSSEKFLLWMHNILSVALRPNKCCNRRNPRIYLIPTEIGVFQVAIRRKGPAFRIRIRDDNVKLDIDFVPSIVFHKYNWPQRGWRKNPFSEIKPDFLIIPKSPELEEYEDKELRYRYWRLSFQEQERIIITDTQMAKPALRLLKRITKKYGLSHCISSYYLKTMLMHEAFKKPYNFRNKSLSYVFMTLLKRYKTCVDRGRIDYFWCRFNLIEDKDLKQVRYILSKTMQSICLNKGDELEVAKCILTRREFKHFMEEDF